MTQTIKDMRRRLIMLSPMKVILTLRVLGVRGVVGKPLDVLLQKQLVTRDPLLVDESK